MSTTATPPLALQRAGARQHPSTDREPHEALLLLPTSNVTIVPNQSAPRTLRPTTQDAPSDGEWQIVDQTGLALAQAVSRPVAIRLMGVLAARSRPHLPLRLVDPLAVLTGDRLG
jgi:hypothetical protein